MLEQYTLAPSAIRAMQPNDLPPTRFNRFALIVGDGFPPDLLDDFCAHMFREGTEVTRIAPDDSRLVHPAGYHEGPLDGQCKPVRALSEKASERFGAFGHVNFFPVGSEGGVIFQTWDREEVETVLRFGFA